MAPHSSTLAWKIPWTEEPGGCSPWVTKSDTTVQFHFHFSLSCIGEGNGNPLQCSCLENPRDGRAWWAAVYGVAQSQTQLKRLSKQASKQADRRKIQLFLKVRWRSSCLSLSILPSLGKKVLFKAHKVCSKDAKGIKKVEKPEAE